MTTKAHGPHRSGIGRAIWRSLGKVARVATYGAVVCLASGALAARSAYGDVQRSAFALGEELGKLGDGPTRPVRINGQPVFVAAQSQELSVDEVLDRTEAACRKNSAALLGEIPDLGEAVKRGLAIDPAGREAAGITRIEDRRGGYVACFVREGATSSEAFDVVKRLTAVVDTGDLGKLGALRYVYAERLASGRTRIVSAWTQGSFDLRAFVPKGEGDTPGSDPVGAPRPEASTRLLSAAIDGAPYGVRVYRSERSPEAVLAQYEAAMPERGWQLTVGADHGGRAARVFHRPGGDLYVIAEPHEGRTVVTLVDSRAD